MDTDGIRKGGRRVLAVIVLLIVLAACGRGWTGEGTPGRRPEAHPAEVCGAPDPGTPQAIGADRCIA